MGIVNQSPDLKKMIDDIHRRLNALERSRQVSVPVVANWASFPRNPQPGSLFLDTSTGLLFVYAQDVSATTTVAATYTANPLSFTVSSVGTLQVNQTVAVDGGTGKKFVARVTTVTAPFTVGVTFLAVTPASAVPTGFTATLPANPTVFPIGTKVVARSWRQIVTTTDLMNKVAGLTTSSFGGTNSTVGSHTGGTGEIVAYGGYPPYTSG